MRKSYFGMKLTVEEEEKFLLLKKRLKSPSFTHTMRLLINEKYDEIMSESTITSVKPEMSVNDRS